MEFEPTTDPTSSTHDDVETDTVLLPTFSDVLDQASGALDEVDERLRSLDSADR